MDLVKRKLIFIRKQIVGDIPKYKDNSWSVHYIGFKLSANFLFIGILYYIIGIHIYAIRNFMIVGMFGEGMKYLVEGYANVFISSFIFKFMFKKIFEVINS